MSESPRGAAWRCFIAVPLPPEIRAPLAAMADEWRGDLDARWTDAAGWHLSLHFIGPVEQAFIGALTAALFESIRDADDRGPMSVELGGVSALPSTRRPRVLYCAVSDPDGHLERLSLAARSAVTSVVGAQPEAHPFMPHVTLARFRRAQPLDRWLAGLPAASWRMPIEEVSLMRSHLGRGPAHYETLATFAVGRTAVLAAP